MLFYALNRNIVRMSTHVVIFLLLIETKIKRLYLVLCVFILKWLLIFSAKFLFKKLYASKLQFVFYKKTNRPVNDKIMALAPEFESESRGPQPHRISKLPHASPYLRKVPAPQDRKVISAQISGWDR